MFFGLKPDGDLCYHIVSGIIISMDKSKVDIFFIESFHLSRVLRYITVIKVSYFDHNKELRLAIFYRICSFDIVKYVFVYPTKINVTIFY